MRNGLGSEITAIKREYYHICLGLMEDLRRKRGLDFNARTAVMSLFGMINWIYTWYNPRVDGNAEALAERMGNIVLNGIVRSGKRAGKFESCHPKRSEGSAVRRRRQTAGHD